VIEFIAVFPGKPKKQCFRSPHGEGQTARSAPPISFCLAKSHRISYDFLMNTALISTNSVHGSLGRSASFLIPLLIACAAFLQTAHAVNPPPDGSYPGGNTAEGQDALLSLSTGTYNTATGYLSLKSNTTGSFNGQILGLNEIGIQRKMWSMRF
jgi:hypothetical protein